MKVDSREEYAVFVNENNYDGELNSMDRVVDFLKKKYLDPLVKQQMEDATGHSFDRPEPFNIKTPKDIEIEKKEMEEARKSNAQIEEIVKWIMLSAFIFIVILVLLLF